jgi:dethiobiotin synthetase
MSERIFVTGTGTDVGKTVLSALLCAALDACYWKPIQTGSHEGTDRDRVVQWAELPAERTCDEAYTFPEPVSPHLAAEWRATTIELDKIKLPQLRPGTRLIIEGAGGALVPIAPGLLMRDLILHLRVPAVVAATTALGTINHALLTLEALRAKEIPLLGVVLVGEANEDNRRAIEAYGNTPVVGWIPPLPTIDRASLLAAWEQHFFHRAFTA